MTQSCATCRHFLATDEASGICRRYPPVVIVNQSRLSMEPMKSMPLAQPGGALPSQVLDAVTVQSHFPQLSAVEGYCGEYAPRKDVN